MANTLNLETHPLALDKLPYANCSYADRLRAYGCQIEAEDMGKGLIRVKLHFPERWGPIKPLELVCPYGYDRNIWLRWWHDLLAGFLEVCVQEGLNDR